MKINQADEKVLTTLFGKEVVDKLSGALKDDDGEVSLDLRIKGRVITDTEEATLKESSVQQGKEIGYKEIAKNLEIELNAGEKDPVIISDKFKSVVTAEMEEKYKDQTPADELLNEKAKAKDWEDKYNKLHETHDALKGDLDTEKTNYTNLQKEILVKERNNKILSSLPEKINQDRNDALLIITNSFEFEQTEGKEVIKKDGKIIRNGAGEPETLDNVISGFVEEKKWIKGAGAGGDDRDGNKFTKRGLSAEDAEKAIIESGKDPGSPEGLKLFNEMTAEK